MLLLMQLSNTIQHFSEGAASLSSLSNVLEEGKMQMLCSLLNDTNVSNSRSASFKSDAYTKSTMYKVTGSTPHLLHAAIMADNPAAVSYLLEAGCSVHTEYQGFTPLSLCLTFGHFDSEANGIDIVKILIGNGASINLHNLLHTACQRGLSSVIRKLCSNIYQFNAKECLLFLLCPNATVWCTSICINRIVHCLSTLGQPPKKRS